MIDLTKRYYLLESGRVYVSFKEIDPKFVRENEDGTTSIAMFVFGSLGTADLRWEKVINATDELYALEILENQYFYMNWIRTNKMFSNIDGKRHCYKYSDGPEAFDKVIDMMIKANRNKIIEQEMQHEQVTGTAWRRCK